ncbi:hypothetical protein EDWATA_02310 [Edwardsiella tarda ATCC 23685]|uniref:Uncharacterized protein n=1 Tax=Edwardsiella tarda ATCC 23685 TaxID=500638 RepID=D4F6C9_EDWTA|nr:hypothetical protein EDWATA_02310 [Edwardsiella tarda ATCC 23685]
MQSRGVGDRPGKPMRSSVSMGHGYRLWGVISLMKCKIQVKTCTFP